MRTVPIGIAMLNDERPHVWQQNNPQNVAIVNRWAEIIRQGLKNQDGSAPEVVVASAITTSTRVAQAMGEELRRAGRRAPVLCIYARELPILSV